MVMAAYKSPALISRWATQTQQRCACRRKPNGQDIEIKSRACISTPSNLNLKINTNTSVRFVVYFDTLDTHKAIGSVLANPNLPVTCSEVHPGERRAPHTMLFYVPMAYILGW